MTSTTPKDKHSKTDYTKASLILGVIGILIDFVLPVISVSLNIIGLVFGVISLKRSQSRSKTILAIIINIIAIVLCIVFCIIIIHNINEVVTSGIDKSFDTFGNFMDALE